MPKGSYSSRSYLGEAESYSASLNLLSDITGTTNVQLVKYIDESVKTGNEIFFTGGNEKKYFVIIDYTMSTLLSGEDHRK